MNGRDKCRCCCIRPSFPDVRVEMLSDQVRRCGKRAEKSTIGGCHEHSIDTGIGEEFLCNLLLCRHIGIGSSEDPLHIGQRLVIADDAGRARQIVIHEVSDQLYEGLAVP